jgi:hypothetical protein
MNKTHEYRGECLFCTSLCPACGSNAVQVKYTPTFEYGNDMKDHITIFHYSGDIELECSDCGERIESSEDGHDENLISCRALSLRCLNWRQW